MRIPSLRLSCSAVILAASVILPTVALAQTYPSKTVRIVLPLAAGSPVEVEARRLAKDLEARWNQPVIIEHRPGAGTTVGAAVVASSPPDGYTLLFGSGSMPTIRIVQPSANVDPLRDFEYIAISNEFPSNVLVTNKFFPGSTWAQFVEYAKANPGKVNYGSIGGVQFLAMEAIKRAAGIELVEVRYPGGATQSTPALLRNDVQLVVSSVGTARPQHDAGAMKMLLVLGERPPPGMPEVPTTSQLGYSGVRSFAWFALLAPAKTSAQIVEKISADVALFVQSADTKQREAAGQIVARYAGSAETRRVVEADYNAWASIAKAINYKPD